MAQSIPNMVLFFSGLIALPVDQILFFQYKPHSPN